MVLFEKFGSINFLGPKTMIIQIEPRLSKNFVEPGKMLFDVYIGRKYEPNGPKFFFHRDDTLFSEKFGSINFLGPKEMI